MFLCGRSSSILNEKAFPAFVDHEPVRLAADDIKLISFHLSRYIRGGVPS
jgi:hypothetical protein